MLLSEASNDLICPGIGEWAAQGRTPSVYRDDLLTEFLAGVYCVGSLAEGSRAVAGMTSR